jgi:hypothetical protein
MAKLTDVPVVTSLADNDLVYAVDISNTTDDPAGSSVAITKANLVGGGGGGIGTKTRAVMTEIARVVDPGTGIFNFNGLDLSEYDSITLTGSLRGKGASTASTINVYLNGDTTDANYFRQATGGLNGGANNSETAAPDMWYGSGGGSAAGNFSSHTMSIEFPAGTQRKMMSGTNASTISPDTYMYSSLSSVRWDGTAAITDIQVVDQLAEGLEGTIVLYGRKTEELGGTTGHVIKEEIGRITDPGTGQFDFTGITSASYDRLIIQGSIKSTVAGVSDATRIFFNGDTNEANYFYQRIAGDSGLAVGVEGDGASRFAVVTGSTAPAGNDTRVEMIIETPAGSQTKQATTKYSGRDGSADAFTGQNSTYHDTLTAAITSLLINSPTDNLTGTLILYGERTL